MKTIQFAHVVWTVVQFALLSVLSGCGLADSIINELILVSLRSRLFQYLSPYILPKAVTPNPELAGVMATVNVLKSEVSDIKHVQHEHATAMQGFGEVQVAQSETLAEISEQLASMDERHEQVMHKIDEKLVHSEERTPPLDGQVKQLATGEAACTPMSEVIRVLGLLPKPEIGFVDFGCGYDARWCIAAAERWGCKCIGVEIDSSRASAARERVRNLGLSHLITILEGDAGVVPVSGDVAVAYLYPTLLARLKPRLEWFKAFASYLHQPPGMNTTKNGDTWFYRRQHKLSYVPQSVPQSAVWNSTLYNQPLCTSPNCAMCNSIRRQLGQ